MGRVVRAGQNPRRTVAAGPGRGPHDAQHIAREFRVAVDAPVADVIERGAAEGVNPGYALGREYPEYADGLLVAITERRSRADIDRLADVLIIKAVPLEIQPSCRAILNILLKHFFAI